MGKAAKKYVEDLGALGPHTDEDMERSFEAGVEAACQMLTGMNYSYVARPIRRELVEDE